MKKLYLLILFAFLASMSFAQEVASPLPFGVKIEKYVDYAIINGNVYENCVVTFETTKKSWRDLLGIEMGVTVIVKNRKKRIYKKKLQGLNLYMFSNGQIEVSTGGKTHYVLALYSKEYKTVLIDDNGI